MLLEDVKVGDLVIFANGDEAIIKDIVREFACISLLFDKGVLGKKGISRSWSYRYDGEWIIGGNNIIKVIHKNGG